jgi:ATP-binding cassette subfamily B protein
MKKYLKIMWDITKGHRGAYLFSFVLQFFAITFMLLATFMTKVLVDTIQGDAPTGPIDTFLTNLFGGQAYLADRLWIFSVIILGLGTSRALIFWAHVLPWPRGIQYRSRNATKIVLAYRTFAYPALKKAKSGDYIQTCTRDEETVRSFVTRQLFGVTYTVIILIESFFILWTLSWEIALITISILPVMFIYSFVLIKRVRKLYRATEDSDGLVSAKIEETLSGIRLVKAYNNENYEIKEFDDHLQDYRRKFIKWRKL